LRAVFIFSFPRVFRFIPLFCEFDLFCLFHFQFELEKVRLHTLPGGA